MTNRHSAAREAVSAGACAPVVMHVAAPVGQTPTHYPSRLHPGMFFKRRTSCDSIVMDTPHVPVAEITADPYAAEGRRLAVEDLMRRDRAGYFEWRQSIGNDYYDEQDRLAGRVAASGRIAANDNVRAGRAVA